MLTVPGLLNDYSYLGLFSRNAHTAGFAHCLMASNTLKPALQNPGQKQKTLAFISYDHKNNIEDLQSRNLTPAVFPNQLFFESEKEFSDRLVHDLINAAPAATPAVKINPTVTKQTYIEKVNALKQHIRAGDVYELNYCICFEAHNAVVDPLQVYKRLNALSKAPYSALAKFGSNYIISSSPELFLSRKGNLLFTKPIKGTAPRGKNREEDAQLKNELQQSLKERTENIMIVDVARNDLSRLARRGTVNVNGLYTIETFEQVHQMVSTVSCELKENYDFGKIINATFPMASMTGAPKIRAMQLIDEYELYSRGPYSGCLGCIEPNGDFDLSVLIRSIFYNAAEKYLSFSVGSAITHLCDPEKEYEECLLKAKAMMRALGN